MLRKIAYPIPIPARSNPTAIAIIAGLFPTSAQGFVDDMFILSVICSVMQIYPSQNYHA